MDSPIYFLEPLGKFPHTFHSTFSPDIFSRKFTPDFSLRTSPTCKIFLPTNFLQKAPDAFLFWSNSPGKLVLPESSPQLNLFSTRFPRNNNRLDYFPANIPRQFFLDNYPQEVPNAFTFFTNSPGKFPLQKITKHSPTFPIKIHQRLPLKNSLTFPSYIPQVNPIRQINQRHILWRSLAFRIPNPIYNSASFHRQHLRTPWWPSGKGQPAPSVPTHLLALVL